MSKKTSKMEWKPYLPFRGRSQRVPTKRDFTFTKSWASSQGSQEETRELTKAANTREGRRESSKTAGRPHKEQSPEDPESPTHNVITSPLARIIPTVVEDTEEDMEVGSDDEEEDEVVPETQQDLASGSITEETSIVNDVVFDIRKGQILPRTVQTQVIPEEPEDEEEDINQEPGEDRGGAENLRYEAEMEIEGEGDMAEEEPEFDEHIEAGHFARFQKNSNLSTVSHAPSFRLQRHSTPIPVSRRSSVGQAASPSAKKKSPYKPAPSPEPDVVTRRTSTLTEPATRSLAPEAYSLTEAAETTSRSPLRSRSKQTAPVSPARSRSRQTTPGSPARSRSKQTAPGSPARSRSKPTTPLSPTRSRSKHTAPVSPARSRSNQTAPLSPARSRSKQTAPVSPARSQSKQTSSVSPAKSRSRQTTPVSPTRSQSKQSMAVSPVRSRIRQRSKETAPVSPTRSRSRETTPDSPARSRREQTTPISPARSQSRQNTPVSPARSRSKQTSPSSSEVEASSKRTSRHSDGVSPSASRRTSPRSDRTAAAQQDTPSPAAGSPETLTVPGNTNTAPTPGKSQHKASPKQSKTQHPVGTAPTPTTTHKEHPVEKRRTLFSAATASPPATAKGRKAANKAPQGQATMDSFLCVTPRVEMKGTKTAGRPAQQKPRAPPEVDENMPTDVRVWQGGSKRSMAQLTDLDIILDRLEETAWNVKDQTDDRVKRKAINRMMVKTQSDIQQAIADSHAVVKLKTSVARSAGIVKRKRKDLFRLQSETASLKADIINLKKQHKLQSQGPPHHDQKAMQDISEFLFKLSSLNKNAVKSKKAPTDFVIIGSTSESEVLSESSSVRRRLDLRDGHDSIVNAE